MLISDEEIVRRKKYLEIRPEDERRLEALHSVLERHAGEIIEKFYAYLLTHEFTKKFLETPGMIERLKKLQAEYFLRLTSGRYDREYFENRLKVGFAHERVGLAPQWYMGAYETYFRIVSEVLHREVPAEQYHDALGSLTKIISLDIGLAIDAYIFKAHERLEETNRKLLQLDRVKRQLTEMIVHDLQNPLAGIEAFLQYVRSRGRLEGEEVEALEEALARCGDLENMIQNVLQLRKMEEGKLELYVEDLDLRDFVPRCAAAFDLVAKQHSKALEIVVPDSGVPARTDQTILQRILYNLIRNAIKHTRKGTSIRVAVTADREISVTDDGPGIPKELQPRVFEPYGSMGIRGSGMRMDTGLGLPFCRMAVEALGATLSLRSESGQGTTFSFRIP